MTGGIASVAACRVMSGSTFEPFSIAIAVAGISGAMVVASCRDSIELRQLHDLRDVPRDRLWRHQILVAGHCRYFSRFKMANNAITLQAPGCSGMTGSGV